MGQGNAFTAQADNPSAIHYNPLEFNSSVPTLDLPFPPASKRKMISEDPSVSHPQDKSFSPRILKISTFPGSAMRSLG
jgi:hypothetical protein